MHPIKNVLYNLCNKSKRLLVTCPCWSFIGAGIFGVSCRGLDNALSKLQCWGSAAVPSLHWSCAWTGRSGRSWHSKGSVADQIESTRWIYVHCLKKSPTCGILWHLLDDYDDWKGILWSRHLPPPSCSILRIQTTSGSSLITGHWPESLCCGSVALGGFGGTGWTRMKPCGVVSLRQEAETKSAEAQTSNTCTVQSLYQV